MAQRRTKAIAAGGGRERLLKAATRLFATKGYAATSVRDIVSTAGITAPSLYHHFGSKEGLFLAILRVGQARADAAQREVLTGGGSATARILRLGRVYVALRRELADVAGAVARVVVGPQKKAPRFDFKTLAARKVRIFEQIIEEGVASGEFRPCTPRHVALALSGAVEIACRPTVFDMGSGGTDAGLEGMFSAILSGITAKRG